MGAQPPFLPGASYDTPLDPLRELMFRGWVKDNNVPFNPDAGVTDYDMRGYWQGRQNGNPMARPTVVDPNDNRPHYTDYYKVPTHNRFSSDSQWAGKDAPVWVNNDQLSDTRGKVIADDRPSGLSAVLQLMMGK